jgi:hypothetical protein
MIVYPETVEHTFQMAEWAAQRLGEPLEAFGFDRRGMPLFQCMGFARDDKLLCVVVAYHRTRDNIFMAFAADSPRWASKENVAAMGAWVFGQLGVKRVSAAVKKDNKRARKFDEGIGFKPEGKIRKADNGKDIMIYGMLKEEHEQWLRKAFNGKQRKH